MLVWGYERHGDLLRLHTYDCNHEGRDDIFTEIDVSAPKPAKPIRTNGTHGPSSGQVRGFFRLHYRAGDPALAYVDDCRIAITGPRHRRWLWGRAHKSRSRRPILDRRRGWPPRATGWVAKRLPTRHAPRETTHAPIPSNGGCWCARRLSRRRPFSDPGHLHQSADHAHQPRYPQQPPDPPSARCHGCLKRDTTFRGTRDGLIEDRQRRDTIPEPSRRRDAAAAPTKCPESALTGSAAADLIAGPPESPRGGAVEWQSSRRSQMRSSGASTASKWWGRYATSRPMSSTWSETPSTATVWLLPRKSARPVPGDGNARGGCTASTIPNSHISHHTNRRDLWRLGDKPPEQPFQVSQPDAAQRDALVIGDVVRMIRGWVVDPHPRQMFSLRGVRAT